jgi:CheY-like chemotaxis protein
VVPRVAHVLKQNDGHLWLDRRPDEAVDFNLYFPSMAGRPIGLPEPADAHLGGQETLLIVENDPGLRETMSEYLKGLGYRVVRAGHGEEALEKLRSVPRVDAVITDLDLPGGGEELAQRLSAHGIAAKLLLVSGGMNPLALGRQPGAEKPAVLCKPFQLRALAGRLRDLLDGNARGAARGAAE